MKKPHLSVAVPTYRMEDGEMLFRRLLDSLWVQTYQDFEIVVTDNSEDDAIENICKEYRTGISYYRNPNKGMSVNTNAAMRLSQGEIIKVLYMDDFLAHEQSLEKIIRHFRGQWLVTSCRHTIDGIDTFSTHHPRYSEDIYTGNNTIGSPSVLTIKNENIMLFDENLGWMLDCDYYKRMYQKYGNPVILRDINVVLGLHAGQVTNMLPREAKNDEFNYMMKKYE
jgi:glycosyltransferase involved in cell wall biosynthesis